MEEKNIDGVRYRHTKIRDYWISEYGDVYNVSTNRFLKASIGENGYKRIELKIAPGKPKKFLVHRLVYSIFIGELKEQMVIDHIDADRQNNHYSNLRQVTQKENISHAIELDNFGHNASKSIKVLNTETNVVTEYASVKDFLIHINAPKYMIDNRGFNIIKKRREYHKYILIKEEEE